MKSEKRFLFFIFDVPFGTTTRLKKIKLSGINLIKE